MSEAMNQGNVKLSINEKGIATIDVFSPIE